MMIYRSLNDYLRETFGGKVYKIALSSGCTCPNRDGSIGSGGCIFCSAGGSGEFAQSSLLSVSEQIESAKRLVARKVPANARYIAYFQSYTNTYAPVSMLRPLFTEAICHPDVAALSIATRPDCLPEDILSLLAELNQIKPVWVELGLQTIHPATAAYIRRGYELPVFEAAVQALHARGISVIVHLILGLPGERVEDMAASARFVSDLLMENRQSADGFKFHLLHVLRGTDLEKDFYDGLVPMMSMESYFEALRACLSVISPDLVIHRLTGDGAKKDLVAPLWSANKKAVLNAWRRVCEEE